MKFIKQLICSVCIIFLNSNLAFAYPKAGDIICVTKDTNKDEKVLITLRSVDHEKHVANVEFLDRRKKMFLAATGMAGPKKLNIVFEYEIATLKGVFDRVEFNLPESKIKNLQMICHTFSSQ